MKYSNEIPRNMKFYEGESSRKIAQHNNVELFWNMGKILQQANSSIFWNEYSKEKLSQPKVPV